MSDQSHSALSRAAMIVGVRRERIRMIPSDADFRMDMDALASAVAADRDAGLSPIAVAANAGTAGTGAIDPLEEMADFCAAEGLWLHVDAAYGGFAVVTERGKRLLRGIERADSVGLDAHKWLFQPYEAGCLLVKDENTLTNAFGVRPDILQDTVWGANHPNFSNLGLQLSRSVRALKVWMSVQTFGMAAFRRAVETGMQLAETAEEYIRESPVLEATSTPTLGIVCFRVNPSDDELDEAVLDKVNRTVLARMFWDNPAFMSSMLLHGTFTLRMCIINHTTTRTYGANLLIKRCFFPPALADGRGIGPRFRPGCNAAQEEYQWRRFASTNAASTRSSPASPPTTCATAISRASA